MRLSTMTVSTKSDGLLYVRLPKEDGINNNKCFIVHKMGLNGAISVIPWWFNAEFCRAVHVPFVLHDPSTAYRMIDMACDRDQQRRIAAMLSHHVRDTFNNGQVEM